MGNVLEQLTVLESARFMLACVADEVPLLHSMVEHLVPFRTGREPCPSTPPQAGLLDFSDDVVGREVCQALSPSVISADSKVGIDFPGSPFKFLQHPWLR